MKGAKEMVGMIVTGHGSFATGITSGLKLLAGEPKDYEAVDFLPEDSAEILAQKLETAYEKLSGCEGVVIFADLTGGSPFNVSIRMKMEHPERQLEVIGGSNLPAVLEGYMARMAGAEVQSLAAQTLEAGKNAMLRFVPSADDGKDDYEE